MPHNLDSVKLLLDQFQKSYYQIDRNKAEAKQIQDAKEITQILLTHTIETGALEHASQNELDVMYEALARYYQAWIGPLP